MSSESATVSSIRYGSVRCFYCSYAGTAACARCGKFYCSHHGRAQLNGYSTCIECYDRRRPMFFAVAVLFSLGGLAPLLMPVFNSDLKIFAPVWYGIFGPLAVVFLACAAVHFWYALRAYP
jgi:hypothetical protein